MSRVNIQASSSSIQLNGEKLDKHFYTQDVLTVAEKLLGKIFVRKTGENILAARITEVEAYKGACDEAAHSYGGKTKRNQVMFEEGGLLYVYFIYGVHFCANVVTGKKEEGDAVLLRGMIPLIGLETFALNRFGKTNISDSESKNLLNGPGKICKAFSINRKENGIDLTGDDIYILQENNDKRFEIKTSERIGINKAKELKWRFFIDLENE